jgi:acetyl-CoA carboxylase carboxyl transferase subunit alpha
VPEPIGGAHNDLVAAAALLDGPLSGALVEVSSITSAERLERRYQKFRNMGRSGIEFTEAPIG